MADMDHQHIKRRFPKILADELGFALFLFREMSDEGPELLARYRRNLERGRFRRTLFPAATGEEPAQAPCEYIPPELNWQLKTIADAFEKLHRFRTENGPDEYLAEPVYRKAKQAEAQRPRKNSRAEICAYVLNTRDYEHSDDKDAIIKDAMDRFSVSDRTVYRALKSARNGGS